VISELNTFSDGEKKGWGDMSMYFGCRQSTMDHIYEAELNACAKEGVMSQVNVALSREPGKKKVETIAECCSSNT
jgi:sulfite reductase alpha subunit-like flavoprotein